MTTGRIYCPNHREDFTGTGWLCGANPVGVLTAAHCIGDRQTQIVHDPPYQVQLDGERFQADCLDHDFDLDVALLTIERLPERFEGIQLGNLPSLRIWPSGPRAIAWFARGYPEAHADGLTLTGTITSPNEGVVDACAGLIELFCDQGGVGGLGGASGSAIRVGDEAVGLLRYGPPGLKQRTIFAAPSSAIVKRFPLLAAAVSGVRPPAATDPRVLCQVLGHMQPWQLDIVIHELRADRQQLLPATQPVMQRALQLYERQRSTGESGLTNLVNAIHEVDNGAELLDHWTSEFELTAEISAPDEATTAAEASVNLFSTPDDATSIPLSRSPIVIALEDEDHRLTDSDLPNTERHLTITFERPQVDELDTIGQEAAREPTEKLVTQGKRAWEILKDAQVRWPDVFEAARGSREPQPIAWTGRIELLARVYRAVLLCHPDEADGVEAFLSIGHGGHYFSPLVEGRGAWMVHAHPPRGMSATVVDRIAERALPDEGVALHQRASPDTGEDKARAKGPMAMGAFDHTDFTRTERADASPARPRETTVEATASSSVAIIIDDDADYLCAVGDWLCAQGRGRTRVVVGLGVGVPSTTKIKGVLSQIPCASFGGPSLRHDAVVDGLRRAFTALASRQAAPCIFATMRCAWIKRAVASSDWEALRDGVLWSCWSWVGRPLFAGDFGDILEPAFPHLMDLRSIRADEWYVNREEDIVEDYRADKLVENPYAAFHLYVTGAGGTGKSCFLHHIYKRLRTRPDVLAVWYRVDAPSSKWDEVADRIQKAIVAAVREQAPPQADLLPKWDAKLAEFLQQIGRRVADSRHVGQVVLFIDQLERTFESGDEPDEARLDEISKEILKLLDAVNKVGCVRVFIASRKQYLPDFLKSSRAAFTDRLHFSVLQNIDLHERPRFVEKILEWCAKERLVNEHYSIDLEARMKLADKVAGHPLNMNLALIQLLSNTQDQRRITSSILDEQRPWEKRFEVDLRAAGTDAVEKSVLLAMAHARTEIVRFEEVWWRLRMVDSNLTKQVLDLTRHGVLERLWLRGCLGRTVYARPGGKADRTAFLEFFHANLRDYLLSEVLGKGGTDLLVAGQRWNTPPAWRALDRLAAAARDWGQTQQLIPFDDLQAMMVHRDVVVDTTTTPQGKLKPFHLLFVRDTEAAVTTLRKAAQECFVYSALVHDERGAWAFATLYDELEDRIDCTRRWLQRCPERARAPLLQYMIETKARAALVFIADIVLGKEDSLPGGLWEDVAQILSQSLYAARYRQEVASVVLQRGLAGQDASERVGKFIVAACGGRREELIATVSRCVTRFEASPDEELNRLGELLSGGKLVERWSASLSTGVGVVPMLEPRERRGHATPPLLLIAGSDLIDVAKKHGKAWHGTLKELLSVPLPPIDVAPGEVGGDELELRIRGDKSALGKFYWQRTQILQRHWIRQQPGMPAMARATQNDALGEVVLWVDGDMLSQASWELPSWDFDEAVVDWLEDALRDQADNVFDFDLLIQLLSELASDSEGSRLFHGVSLPVLRQVVANLLEEGTPLANRHADMFKQFAHLVSEVKDAVVLTEKLREYFKDDLCRSVADATGQLPTMMIDPALDKALSSHNLRQSERGPVLTLDPARALALASVVRGALIAQLEQDVYPVVLCGPLLRLPLSRMLRRFDRRIRVISTTELAPSVSVVPVGRIVAPWAS